MAAPLPAPNSWAAAKENMVAIWNIHLEPGASFTFPEIPSDVHRTLYFYEGDSCVIDSNKIKPNNGIILNPIELTVTNNGLETAHFLILQGKPIEEPVAKYGPFVMNTNEEIEQAMEEYRLTQFGGWPWPSHEMVHPRNQGRFAKHPDGREDIKQ